jgi:hypothetical protein
MFDSLWTPADLAAYLHLSRSTVLTLASRDPDSLPPRVAMLRSPRWSPEVVRAWVIKHSGGGEKRKGGRPRG